MASSKEYLQFILEQLSELEEISYRAMMGEFIIYYRGKIVGGIYDDRLLVKPIKSAAIGGTSYFLQLYGAKSLPATLLYPFITGGSIVFSTMIGTVMFKEKISGKLLISVVLCFVGTILFI